MRNVVRHEEPSVLRRNGKRWTRELLESIEKAEGNAESVPSGVWNRYNHDEVRAALDGMYSSLCCYCDGRVGDVVYINIEHRKPKRKFPELTFSWHNLHLACQICNVSKGQKWDDANEILDAVIDVPISDHLEYRVGTTGVFLCALTNRGGVTVQHANLNRPGLLRARLEVFLSEFDAICRLRDLEVAEGETPRVTVAKDRLRSLFRREHGPLVEFFARRLLATI